MKYKTVKLYCATLFCHIIITIVSVFGLTYGYVLNGSELFLMIYPIFHIVVIVSLYVVSGYIVTNESRRITVWPYFSVASIGIILWGLCVIHSPYDLNWKSGDGGIWLYYRLYVSGIETPFNFIETPFDFSNILNLSKHINSIINLLILSFIPSLLQFLGGMIRRFKFGYFG